MFLKTSLQRIEPHHESEPARRALIARLRKTCTFFAAAGAQTLFSFVAHGARAVAPPPAEESQDVALRLFVASLKLIKPLVCRGVAQAVRRAVRGCACPTPSLLARRTCSATPAQLRVQV